MSLSRRSPRIAIPPEIVNQEAEIESMFQNLIGFDDRACLRGLQHQTDRAREQQIATWILIGVFVLISIMGFYLLGRESGIFG